MILNVHLDASYLSAPNNGSHIVGYYFLGSVPKYQSPIKVNDAFHVLSTILKLVAALAAEVNYECTSLVPKKQRFSVSLLMN